jgi:hypothetical protein
LASFLWCERTLIASLVPHECDMASPGRRLAPAEDDLRASDASAGALLLRARSTSAEDPPDTGSQTRDVEELIDAGDEVIAAEAISQAA